MTVAGTRSTSRSSAQVVTTRWASCQAPVLAEQPGTGLGRQPQGVLADQPAGVGVVRGDGRLAGQHRRAPRPPLGSRSSRSRDPARRRSRDAHPDPELLGGLAGERQAEDLLGEHLPGGDQPDHAGGHRLGLARPGAGDDERRARGRGDHRGLLVRGRWQAQRGGEGPGGSALPCPTAGVRQFSRARAGRLRAGTRARRRAASRPAGRTPPVWSRRARRSSPSWGPGRTAWPGASACPG